MWLFMACLHLWAVLSALLVVAAEIHVCCKHLLFAHVIAVCNCMQLPK
jgi:hypothetical protein